MSPSLTNFVLEFKIGLLKFEIEIVRMQEIIHIIDVGITDTIFSDITLVWDSSNTFVII